jgi:hypothetical protein
MTPKEKAKDLVYKFYPSVQWKLGQEDCLDRAKQCALIAVEFSRYFITGDLSESFDKTLYLLEVKSEIELL